MRKRLRKKLSRRPYKRIEFKLVDSATGEAKHIFANWKDEADIERMMNEVKFEIDANPNIETHFRLLEK